MEGSYTLDDLILGESVLIILKESPVYSSATVAGFYLHKPVEDKEYGIYTAVVDANGNFLVYGDSNGKPQRHISKRVILKDTPLAVYSPNQELCYAFRLE